MKYKFKVTKEIIAQAAINVRNGDSIAKHCAVVETIRQVFPEARSGSEELVLYNNTNWNNGEDVIIYPKEVTEYVRRFDRTFRKEDFSLPEFEFELDIPEHLIPSV